MKKILVIFFSFAILCSGKIFSQSMNCNTATQITLTSGAACVNGTNVGAVTDNVLYGTCNSTPVNMVWYTYVTNGSNNSYTVDPGTMQNAELVIYTGTCPLTGQLQNCVTATGGSNIITSWGMTAGIQVWIGIASTTLQDGTFQFCVNSQPPVAGAGNTCSQAIPICSPNYTMSTIPSNSSGQAPSCFGSAPQQDVFIKFTVTQAGTLAWTATCPPATEYDWCLWNISGGCPGVEVCCNYNYAAGSGAGFGMQNSGGNAGCGTSAFGADPQEFSPTINVTCGQTYAIQISNYSNNNNGFNLAFTNSTCQISSTASFTATPALVCGATLNATITDASVGDCAAVWNYGDGSATYTGGTPPAHTYTAPGTYAITETIGGACPSTVTHFVQLLAPVTATVTSTAVTCPGQCNGTASITNIDGGNGIYTYTWNPGGVTTTTVGGLCAGNYTASIYNAACNTTITQSVNVGTPPPMTVTVNSPTICRGASTTLTAGGATTYSWSPATGLSSTTGASVTANPTVTTTYTVVGTTGSCTAAATSTVTVNPTPTITVNSFTMCPGSTGTLTANGANTYTWTPAGTLSSSTGSVVTASPTVTTTYTITGTSVAGCTATATATVTIGGTILPTANNATICIGNSATLTANGGSTYTWSPGTGLSATTGSTVTASPTVTTTYTITAANGGCTGTTTAAVTVNPLPTVNVNNATYCTGGSATLTATGASTYTWSPGTGLSSTTGASVTANPTVTTNYTITGTSAAGCVNTATTSVTVVTTPTVTANSATLCVGASATLTANGAVTYTWSPGTGLSSTTGASVTANPTVTTTYTISGTAGTCTASGTAVVTVNPLPTVTVNSATICAGQQTATLTAGGATTYSWSPATGLSGTTGASVTANPSATTTYTITGTNANNCVNTATAVVTVNATPTISITNGFICNGSTATLTASGASTYTWSPATGLSSTTGSTVTGNPGTTTQYTITATDANGCTDSDTTSITVVNNPTVTVNTATICVGQQTATLTANGAVTYAWSPATGLSGTTGSSVTANPGATTVYTITGTAGTCTAVATTTVTVNPLPVVSVNSGTICAGQQTATLTANGANTYAWSPATGLSGTTGTSVTANPGSTTAYTITGTDVNGCTNTATSTVTVNALPTLTLTSGFICNGSSTTLNASGASTYTWSPGTGLSSTTGSTVTGNPPSTTQYTVTGTDANGCTDSDTTSITVVNNPTVSVTSGTICVGQQTATLTASGAATYVWSPATGLSSTTGSLVTANPGATTVYTITGTAGTCTAVATTTVTVNPLPVVTAGSNSPVCVNQNLTLTSSGGVSYSWSGPSSFTSTTQNPTINGVVMANGGVYSVTATDANGCFSSATTTVVINPLPVVVATGATVCVNSTINLSCNNSGITFSWSGPNAFSSNLQNPSIPGATAAMAGSYVVTVTDANGCSSGNVANVVVNPSLVINATNNSPICQNGQLVLATGAGISWSWNGPGGFTSASQTPVIPNVQVTASGVYTVTGTDANGCTGTATTTVVINPLPTITVNSATICVTQQTATLTATGGVSYAWTPAGSLSSSNGNPVTATPLVTTVYTVTGTDANGCVSSGTGIVTVNSLPIVTANSATICVGNSAQLTATGAASYSWTPATGLSSSVGSPVTANPASSTSYTVTGTDANGCFNTGSSNVTVNSLPNVSVTSAAMCAGASAVLSASGANTYAWSPATGLTATTGANVGASPSATSTYVVTGTDINGCSNTATAVATVNPLPVVSASPQNTSGCAPLCVTLSNDSSSSGSCSWNFGDGSTSTACTVNHCYTGSGSFIASLTLTDGNGCVGTDNATITVYPVPDADFNWSPNPASTFNSTIQFFDASTGALITSWNWTLGDPNNTTSTYQNPVWNYQDAGSYPVTLAVASNYGCVDSITKILIIDPEFMLYVPNAFSPNYDGTNDVFMAKGEGIKDFRIYIFDRWGMQVFYSENIDKGWDGRMQGKGEDILQEDVYVWKIEVKTYKNEPRQLKGTVTLIK